MSDDPLTPPRFPPPTRREWVLLAINIVFVLLGLILLADDRDKGIVTLALFGSCLAVTAATIIRKRRYGNFSAEKVDVVGHVPIRPKTGLMQLSGAWLAILGVIFVVFGHDYSLLFRCLGGVIAIAGAAVLVAALTGRWPGGFLQFDPEGLTIANRLWRAQLLWDEITSVQEAEYHSNPVLLIAVADAAMLDITPPQARGRAIVAIAQRRGMMGADFAIMTTHYGIDLPVLAETVARYVGNAGARAELRPRLS